MRCKSLSSSEAGSTGKEPSPRFGNWQQEFASHFAGLWAFLHLFDSMTISRPLSSRFVFSIDFHSGMSMMFLVDNLCYFLRTIGF